MATSPSFYPDQIVREAMELARRERPQECELDANASFDKYVKNPELMGGTPAIWRKLHFCRLGPEVRFDGTKWIIGSNIFSCFGVATDQDFVEQFGEDRAFGQAFVFDADLEDAVGKLYKIRVVYNDGSADQNTGRFGKVFDRLDTSRVYADILSHGDSETKIIPTALVDQVFVEHEDLAALKPFVNEVENTPHQFCMMVRLMMRMKEPISTFSAVVEGSRFERLMIKLLCKPGGAANAGNLAAQVLVQDPHTGMFAEFLDKTRYVSHTHECRDTSMDWYAECFLGLVRVIQLCERGDLAGAASLLQGWQDCEDNLFSDMETFFDIESVFIHVNADQTEEWDFGSEQFLKPGPCGIAAFLAHVKPLVLGLDKDEQFCVWVEEQLMKKNKKRKAE